MSAKGPIVVIDDDPDDQYLYKKALERFDIDNQIISFDNGQDALAFLREAAVAPFLIFCDINMPMMTGLEMREAMCNDHGLCEKSIPFVFMSTSARPSDIDKAYTLSTHGFFQKESSFEEHERLLKKIIDYWASCRYSGNHAA